jgi:all-trans-retinol 13,14-reductase
MDAQTRKCDVLIFGSGFGGLATANLLAQVGKRVVLVEARKKLGGLLRSYKREGVDCPGGVHYFGAAGTGELLGQFFDILGVREQLQLRRLGASGVIDRYVFDDGVFDLPPSVDAFETSLRARFPDHAAAVDFVVDMMRATAQSLRIDADGNVAKGVLGGLALAESAQDVLKARGCPDDLLQIMAVQSFWTGSDLCDSPLPYPFMVIGSLLQSAWELGCTGSEMADAISAKCGALGVETITSDPVERVSVSGGRASGVRLRSGLEIEAGHVVCATHPKSLMGMVPAGAWPQSYADSILGLRETSGAFGVVALVDRARHPALDFNAFRIREASGGQECVYVQIRPTKIEGKNRIVVLGRSDYDDWSRWEGTQTHHRDADYAEKKRIVADRFLACARDAVGPILEPKIVDMWTPLTLRDYTGSVRGSIYGIRHSMADGIERLVLTRTQLPGLSIVGQNAIAPGLIGVALSVLRVAADVSGRSRFRQFLAERAGAGA